MRRFTREYHDNKVNKLLGGRIVLNPAFRLERDGIITENPTFNYAFQKLVTKGLRTPYNMSDTREALKDLQEDFWESSMYRANVMRLGRRGVFMDYLRGLPSSINLIYKYNEITDFLVQLTGEEEIRDLCVQEIDFFFWAHVEYAIHTLLREHCLPAMDSLDILD